jgi:hypothetical protein
MQQGGIKLALGGIVNGADYMLWDVHIGLTRKINCRAGSDHVISGKGVMPARPTSSAWLGGLLAA